MTRYSWPLPPYRSDDPAGRSMHLDRFRPPPDPVAAAPPSLAAAVDAATGESRTLGALPKDKGTGNQNLWYPIGPSAMVNGQATGAPNVAGRIRDLQAEPVNGLRVYAASAAGGLWYSADGGGTWRPLDDWASSDRSTVGDLASALSCGAVHVVWGPDADGGKDEVWVGTGEPTLNHGRRAGRTAGLPGGKLGGIGFLSATGPATTGAWSVVTAQVGADPSASDSLRGHSTYRITDDPGTPAQLVAGTTNGLYLRPVGGAWGQVPSWTASAGQPLDVAVTRLSGPDRVRVWVTSTSALFMAEVPCAPGAAISPAALSFTPVVLNEVSPGSRMVLSTSADGATLYVLGQRVARVADNRGVSPAAYLWSVTTTSSPPLMTKIDGVPFDLFGTQADYDMCLAVHPDSPGRVYVGGSYVESDGDYNGGLFRCEVTGGTCVATAIGSGVHADEHIIRIVPGTGSPPAKRTVWVGCDGGVFRSDSDGDPKTFINRNNGLAVLQPGYVASHATNAGIVGAGFQDNGTAVRVGDTVWEESFKGDGGGMVYDPIGQNRYLRQYVYADWQSNDGGIKPVKRRGAKENNTGKGLKSSEQLEEDASLFYSGADAVVHGGVTHLAFGSDRVWYSSDWARGWVTLPTGTDPRRADNPDLEQDVLYLTAPGTYSDTVGSIDCCSSAYVQLDSTTHAYKTGARDTSGILAVKFSPAPDDVTAGNHVLRVLALYNNNLVWITGTRAISRSGDFTWTKIPPGVSAKQQVFRNPDPTKTTETDALKNGTALQFLPAAGLVSDVGIHDPSRGALGSCYVTTIGSENFPKNPDSSLRDTLYFFDGDTTWIACGLRRTTSPDSTWTGTRVTAPALGVVVDPADRSAVYVGTSAGVVKGKLTIGVDGTGQPTYHWDWEQFVNGLPEAAVQDLSIYNYGGLRLLRVALQSRGIWETNLSNVASAPLTYLRLYPTDTRLRIPTPLFGPTSSGETETPRWDNSPDIVVDTSGVARSSPLTEAELRRIDAMLPAGTVAKVYLNDRHPVVHVLVHHRWREPELPADVRVMLMMHEMSGNDPVLLGGVWPVLVAAAGSATPPAILPDGWQKAAPALWQNLPDQVDTRTPRAVSFNVDLSSVTDGSAVALVAVVMSASNQISATDALEVATATNATTVQGLVLSSAHVAAKSIELAGPDYSWP